MSTFNERLQIARVRKGYKQKDLAKIINVSSQNYNHYEKGRYQPSLETVKAISEILEVSSDWLLGVKENFSNNLMCLEQIESSEIIPVMHKVSVLNNRIYGELKAHFSKLNIASDYDYDLASWVEDDTMRPIFKPNDIVLIKTNDYEVIDSHYYLLDYNNINFIQKAYKVEDGFIFKSINCEIVLNDKYNLIGEIVGTLSFF